MKWSPDGRLLAVSIGYDTRISEAATGRQLMQIGNGCSGQMWSRDWKLFADCAEKEIRITELATGKELARVVPKEEW